MEVERHIAKAMYLKVGLLADVNVSILAKTLSIDKSFNKSAAMCLVSRVTGQVEDSTDSGDQTWHLRLSKNL